MNKRNAFPPDITMVGGLKDYLRVDLKYKQPNPKLIMQNNSTHDKYVGSTKSKMLAHKEVSANVTSAVIITAGILVFMSFFLSIYTFNFFGWTEIIIFILYHKMQEKSKKLKKKTQLNENKLLLQTSKRIKMRCKKIT